MNIIKIDNNISFHGFFGDFREWFQKGYSFCKKYNYFYTCLGYYDDSKYCKGCFKLRKLNFIGSFIKFNYLFVLREEIKHGRFCPKFFENPFIYINDNNILFGFYGWHEFLISKNEEISSRVFFERQFLKYILNKDGDKSFETIYYTSTFNEFINLRERILFSFKLEPNVKFLSYGEIRRYFTKMNFSKGSNYMFSGAI